MAPDTRPVVVQDHGAGASRPTFDTGCGTCRSQPSPVVVPVARGDTMIYICYFGTHNLPPAKTRARHARRHRSPTLRWRRVGGGELRMAEMARAFRGWTALFATANVACALHGAYEQSGRSMAGAGAAGRRDGLCSRRVVGPFGALQACTPSVDGAVCDSKCRLRVAWRLQAGQQEHGRSRSSKATRWAVLAARGRALWRAAEAPERSFRWCAGHRAARVAAVERS